MSTTHQPDPDPTHLPQVAWAGRTFPSGLRVRSSLGETPDGDLFSAAYPTGLEVALLIPRYRRDRAGDAVVLDGIRERVLHAIDLKHPNVAEVYATGETADGWLYIVLECLAGEPISRMMAARGAIPVPEAVTLSLQACAGLQAAHALGIVHGNLSPNSLLLVQESDGRPRVKVSGFTLISPLRGRPLEPRETKGLATGYASPERLEGQTPDTRSDVYSLGAVLHHLVAGAPPSPGSLADSVPQTLRPVLTKALSRSPLDRFQSMSDLAAALERAAHLFDRPRKLRAGRRRALITAAASLVAAVGIGVLWTSHRRLEPRKAQPGIQESGRLVVVDRDSVPRVVRSGRAARPSPPHVARSPGPPTSKQPEPTPPRSAPDSVATRVSPFRKSHPWAAVPGGRYYYRSSCPTALRLPDLLFFSTEDEARARGFVPSPVAGCS